MNFLVGFSAGVSAVLHDVRKRAATMRVRNDFREKGMVLKVLNVCPCVNRRG